MGQLHVKKKKRGGKKTSIKTEQQFIDSSPGFVVRVNVIQQVDELLVSQVAGFVLVCEHKHKPTGMDWN